MYSVGDKVRIKEVFDANYGMIGTILRHDKDDDSYLVEFEYDGPSGYPGKTTDWYYGTDEFTSAANPNPPSSPSISTGSYCYHEWRTDSFFTTAVYKTCKKCGKRHEDL